MFLYNKAKEAKEEVTLASRLGKDVTDKRKFADTLLELGARRKGLKKRLERDLEERMEERMQEMIRKANLLRDQELDAKLREQAEQHADVLRALEIYQSQTDVRFEGVAQEFGLVNEAITEIEKAVVFHVSRLLIWSLLSILTVIILASGRVQRNRAPSPCRLWAVPVLHRVVLPY